MRKTICAFLLVFALCGSTFAGDIDSPPLDDPDPIVTVENPEPPSVTPSSEDQTTYSLTEAALTVLNNVLALF